MNDLTQLHIEVFRTGISSEEEAQGVATILYQHPAIIRVAFDLEDKDRILKVVSRDPLPLHIQVCLAEHGIDSSRLTS